MTDIPDEGLLLLPHIENIDKIPNYDNLSISQDKISYQDLLEIISFVVKKNKTVEELSLNPKLIGTIENLKRFQVSDLIRHIMVINYDKIPEEIENKIINKIDPLYLPSWNLPTIEIDRSFRELFLTQAHWIPKENIRNILKEAVEILENGDFEELHDGINYGLNNEVWNFKDLVDLMEILLYPKNYEISKDLSDFKSQLLKAVESFLVEQLLEFENQFDKKFSLTFVLLQSYMEQKPEILISAHEMVDNLWKEMIDHHISKFDTYKYIFLVFYAQLIMKFFEKSVNFVTRRNLIINMINRFEEDVSYNNQVLRALFSRYNIHPWVLDKIIRGFNDFLKMLFMYAKELPKSNEKNRILDQLEISVDLIFDLIFSHFTETKQFSNPHNSVTEFIDDLESSDFKDLYKYNFYELIATISKIDIFINPQLIHTNEYQVKVDLWLKSITYTNIENAVEVIFLYELDILLLTGNYPFEAIFQLIDSEMVDVKTIYRSQTFEKRIVKVISKILSYLETINNLEMDSREAYEILLYFTGEWLQYFSNYDEYFPEASSVLTAIIIICFSNLMEREYAENNIENTFLMYLNLYFFTEYITEKNFQLQSMTQSMPKFNSSIANKFTEMTTEWNIEELIDLNKVEKTAKSIELALNKSTQNLYSSTVDDGMFDDDLLFEYLEYIQSFEKFIQDKLDNLSFNDIMEIENFDFYKKPQIDSLSRLNRIGSIQIVNERKELPFPLIRNIEQMAVAMKIFPFEMNDLENSSFLKTLLDIFGSNQ